VSQQLYSSFQTQDQAKRAAAALMHLEPVLDPLADAASKRTSLGRVLEAMTCVARVVSLLLLFTPLLLSAPIALHWNVRREAWTQMLASTLEAAGPAFIKWGQWAATRRDLFPGDVCVALTRLQMNAATHDSAHSVKVIEAAFGHPIGALFDQFDMEPIASGSVAQVHRAVLSQEWCRVAGHEPGLEVAVKVRHPRVQEIMVRDFSIMEALVGACASLPGLRNMRLQESVAQFRAPLVAQIDFRVEAQNLWRFIHNFRDTQDVAFPAPVPPLVHSEVLVETFESGVSILQLLDDAGAAASARSAECELASRTENGPWESCEQAGGSRAGAVDADAAAAWASYEDKMRNRIARLGCHTLLQMVVKDNFIHADLHPGNLLIREERELPWWCPEWLDEYVGNHLAAPGQSRPKLVLLDAGMVTELSDRYQVHIVDFFKAISSMDGNKVANELLNFSEEHVEEKEAFEKEMIKVFAHMRRIKEAGNNVKDGVAECLDTVRKHQVNVSSELLAVVTAALVLEGWSTGLDQDLNVLHVLEDLLFKREMTFDRLWQRFKAKLSGNGDASEAALKGLAAASG